MSKNYTLDKVGNVFGRIVFNYIDGYDPENVPSYYVVRLEWHAKALNGGAEKKSVSHINVGTSQSVPFTSKEMYTAIKTHIGNVAANKLKDLYADLINDDISQQR